MRIVDIDMPVFFVCGAVVLSVCVHSCTQYSAKVTEAEKEMMVQCLKNNSASECSVLPSLDSTQGGRRR